MKVEFSVAIAAAFLTSAAGAANIYMLTSGIASNDNTVATRLISHGHTVTVGTLFHADVSARNVMVLAQA